MLVQEGVVLLPPPRLPPWQYVLEHVAAARSHAGARPILARPENVTFAIGVAPSATRSTCSAESASTGFTWHTSQPNGGARSLPARCEEWAPVRTASVAYPKMVPGAAPVVLSAPPWHIVQLVCHATVLPDASMVSWHLAHETPVMPPLRSLRWHCWQAARPRSAAQAWKPGSEAV